MSKKNDVIRTILYELYIALHKNIPPASFKESSTEQGDAEKLNASIQKQTIAALASNFGHDRKATNRTKINQELFDVHQMKPANFIPDNLTTQKAKKSIQENMIQQISKFEKKLEEMTINKPANPNSEEYLHTIRSKRHDQYLAEIERQKRRRNVLVREIRFIKSEQDTHRDYELVSRLIRETRFEKHLAAHMISVRKEKNIMIENREQLNRQFEEERLKKFEEYLDTVNQKEEQHSIMLKEKQRQVEDNHNKIHIYKIQLEYEETGH